VARARIRRRLLPAADGRISAAQSPDQLSQALNPLLCKLDDVSENELSMDRLVAEAILEFSDDLRAASEAAERWTGLMVALTLGAQGRRERIAVLCVLYVFSAASARNGSRIQGWIGFSVRRQNVGRDVLAGQRGPRRDQHGRSALEDDAVPTLRAYPC
jgi:hypothetical protein